MAKKQPITLSRCLDCQHAYLMRSAPVNPIVSECHGELYNGRREVATTPHVCQDFLHRASPPTINPMQLLK